jgi:hypothetical protein
MVEEKRGGDLGVGYREHPFARGSDAILSDPKKLEKHNPELHAIINDLQDAGKEVWGHFNANKGAVLTIIGGAAAAAGIVGIGIHIKRRGDRRGKNK